MKLDSTNIPQKSTLENQQKFYFRTTFIHHNTMQVNVTDDWTVKMVKNPVCGHETHFFWLNILNFTKQRLFLSLTDPASVCSSFYVIGEERPEKNTKNKEIFC